MGFESFKSGPEQKPKDDFGKMFEQTAGAYQSIYARNSIEFAHRIAAAEAGVPIKPQDLKKLDFLKSERDTFRKATFKEKTAETEEMLKNFKVPATSDFVRKNPDGKLLMKEDSIATYKWASSLAELSKDGARDFREAKNFTINLDPAHGDRVSFSSERQAPEERFTYDFSRLTLATLAESRDGDNEFTLVPYPHVDIEGKIESKSLLILNLDQRAKLREALFKRLQEQS